MPLTSSISPKIEGRFAEVFDLLGVIKKMESQPPAPDSNQVRILRGLFYVHLYGAFEYSTLQIVLASTQAFNEAQVPHSNVIDALGSLVLDGHYKSIANTKPAGQFRRRLDLIVMRSSSDTAAIQDGVLDFQNIWLHTVELIFDVFGIEAPAMYDITKTGYLRELVDNRNKVAHGRESPLTVGGLKRSDDLDKVYEAIKTQVSYMLGQFNEYLKSERYKAVA
jgi:RiboL-PSP-HEPN